MVALTWMACNHCTLLYHESFLKRQEKLRIIICAIRVNVFASVVVHCDYISNSEAESR